MTWQLEDKLFGNPAVTPGERAPFALEKWLREDFRAYPTGDTSDLRTFPAWFGELLSLREDVNVLASRIVTSRTALKALDTTIVTSAFLVEGDRSGMFVWRTGDYSALVTADTQNGVYIKADAIATTVGAWVRQTQNDELNIRWFGAVGSGNDTTPIQCAIDVAEARNGGTVYVPRGTYTVVGSGTECLLVDGKRVNFRGDGLDVSLIFADSSIPDTRSLLTYRFSTAGNRGLFIRDLTLRTSSHGLHTLYFDLTGDAATHLFEVEIAECYIASTSTALGNGIRVDTHASTGNGGFAYSTIRNCLLTDVYLGNIGDGNTIRNCIFSSAIAKIGCVVWGCSGAGHFNFVENTVACPGGQFLCDGFVSLTLRDNYFETPGSYTSSSPNDAMVDLRGGVRAVTQAVVSGNGFSSLSGTGDDVGLRLDETSYCVIENNRFGTPASVKGIVLTSNAEDTLINSDNRYTEAGVYKDLSITDSGVRTRYENRTGTYTPTGTGVANVDSVTPSANTCYSQNRKEVTVWGSIAIDPTLTGTVTTVRISLPIACVLSNADQLAGTGAAAGVAIRILADTVNNEATLTFVSNTTANSTYAFSLKYRLP